MVNCKNILAKTHCIRQTQKRLIFARENKTRLIFVNKNADPLVKFDIDCLLKQYHSAPPYDFKRCDFIVQHKDINYYVELKTARYDGSFEQIASAIKNLNKCFGDKKCKAIVVVLASCINIASFQMDYRDSELPNYVEDAEIIVSSNNECYTPS
ncbi:MAG: hypothetical protein ACNYPD_01565 [Candidatus Halichondribacter symbioticus]